MAIKTISEVKDWFRKAGVTRRQWAEDHGVSYTTLIDVLRGHNEGNYGEGHKVAVALGIKEEAK